jgi:hypothetical protein
MEADLSNLLIFKLKNMFAHPTGESLLIYFDNAGTIVD